MTLVLISAIDRGLLLISSRTLAISASSVTVVSSPPAPTLVRGLNSSGLRGVVTVRAVAVGVVTGAGVAATTGAGVATTGGATGALVGGGATFSLKTKVTFVLGLLELLKISDCFSVIFSPSLIAAFTRAKTSGLPLIALMTASTNSELASLLFLPKVICSICSLVNGSAGGAVGVGAGGASGVATTGSGGVATTGAVGAGVATTGAVGER